jgi:hypothetical protein
MAKKKKSKDSGSNAQGEPAQQHQRKGADENNLTIEFLLLGEDRFWPEQRQGLCAVRAGVVLAVRGTEALAGGWHLLVALNLSSNEADK